jgi:hypothetical protein
MKLLDTLLGIDDPSFSPCPLGILAGLQWSKELPPMGIFAGGLREENVGRSVSGTARLAEPGSGRNAMAQRKGMTIANIQTDAVPFQGGEAPLWKESFKVLGHLGGDVDRLPDRCATKRLVNRCASQMTAGIRAPEAYSRTHHR